MADEKDDVKEIKEPKDKSKGMMMIIIMMLGVLILAIVGGVVILLMQLNSANDGEQQIVFIDQPPVSELDIRVVPIGTTIRTNLQSPGTARHFAVVDVAVGINATDEDEANEFELLLLQREAAVLDRIISILRRTTRDEIDREGGSEILAEEILISLQDAFDTQMIVRIYFQNISTN